jgi:GNAT superfamily N-acetyltransferase
VQQEIRGVLADVVTDDESETEALVADHTTDGIVGVIAFEFAIDDDTDDAHIKITALAVVHAHRRQGIATALKLSVIDIAAARGINLVWSDVHRQNKPMLELNAKLDVEVEPDPDEVEYMMCVARVEPAPNEP